MRVISVAEMRELERQTFASGVAEGELQRRAGTAVADAIAQICTPGSAVALVGPGNNGRDAWIAVDRLRQLGWAAALYLAPRHAIDPRELAAFKQAGGTVITHAEEVGPSSVQEALAGASVAIDGLLGIGGRGPARRPIADVIEGCNAVRQQNQRLVVAAVDTPSGLDADSGVAGGAAIVADMTVVLGGAKRGLLTPNAARHTGRLVFADIGIVDGYPDAAEVLTHDSLLGLLALPPPDAHKGIYGRLLVVAGSERYVGAPHLVCAAAARAGAGIVTLAAPAWLRDVIAGRLAEATYLPLPEGGIRGAARASAARVLDELDSFSALALGPGLSTADGVGDFVEALLRARAQLGLPAVVDADALNALAGRPAWPDWIGSGVVMTPHLGELRRLAPNDDLTLPSWEIARRLASAWGVTLVVKGPFTGIGSAERAWVNAAPNPALATGGTGDVLTGIVGGLLARGLAPEAAARLGVWAHSLAGARAAIDRQAGGLIASDLLAEIPGALASAIS